VEWAQAYEEIRRAALSGTTSGGVSRLQRQGMAAWMKVSTPLTDVALDLTPRIDTRQKSSVAQILAGVALARLWEDESWKPDRK
jgi:hypothetical protein